MTGADPPASARRDELLELAYRYVLDHGLSGLSLRPLAAAIGSSPRVLLFLFGSKDGLIRALLARARADELALLGAAPPATGLAAVVAAVWRWLAADEHRALLRLWVEAYARSLVEPEGPWGDFAERTLALAVLRGALLDLLASGDRERAGAAVQRHLETLPGTKGGSRSTI